MSTAIQRAERLIEKKKRCDAGYTRRPETCRLPDWPPRAVTVVGPTGSGKTTMLRAIGRLRMSNLRWEGGVTLGEREIYQSDPEIGLVLQDAPVFEHLTVWQNIIFGNRVAKTPPDASTAFAFRILHEFGLIADAHQIAATLSGGQRQRVAVAGALANTRSGSIIPGAGTRHRSRQ